MMKQSSSLLKRTLSVSLGVVVAGCGLAQGKATPVTPAPSGSELAARGSGMLDLAVAWPVRARFRAQLIPTSTDHIDVAVFGTGDGAGVELATASLAASSNATASLALPSGLVNVEADAFSGQVLVASASTEASIQPNLHTPAALSLGPVYVPQVSGFSPASAWPGGSVTIAGTDLSEPWAGTPSVAVGGAPATVSAVSATSLNCPGSGSRSGGLSPFNLFRWRPGTGVILHRGSGDGLSSEPFAYSC